MPPDSVIKLVSRFPSVTNLPGDAVENVVHLGQVGALDPGDLTLYMEEFRDFYIADSGALQSFPLSSYMAESLSRVANACSITAYESTDLTGTLPFGSPIGSISFTLPGALAGSSFPEEVACVLSYHGDLTDVPVTEVNPSPPPATIRPAQRRKGRLYFGPLMAAAGTETASLVRPGSGFTGDVIAAFESFVGGIASVVGGGYFGVWSKADADVYQVVGGYIDNAWDTQRRRGLEPTARTVFSI